MSASTVYRSKMSSSLRLCEIGLDDATRDVLAKELSERVGEADLDSNKDQAILAAIGATALRRYLPGEVLHKLEVFSVTGSHALTLANLPMQDAPPTPVNGFADESTLGLINSLHFGLIQLLGQAPFAVDYENDGQLIRNVVPNPVAAGTTSSWGADSEFFWHTDNPHLPFGELGFNPRPYVPRHLTFCAMRNTEAVATELAAVEDVLAILSPETRDQLTLPQFTIAPPASVGEFSDALHDAAILERDQDARYRIRYDKGSTTSQTPAAEGALADLQQSLAGMVSHDFVLQAGQFLVFDNYRLVHRRRAFTPEEPAEARWLRRCYAS